MDIILKYYIAKGIKRGEIMNEKKQYTREENISFLQSQEDKKNGSTLHTNAGVFFYIGGGAWLNFNALNQASDETLQAAVNFQLK